MTFREMADACCDTCRALEGEGPWCPCCGREMPDTKSSSLSRFTDDVCPTCDRELAAEVAT